MGQTMQAAASERQKVLSQELLNNSVTTYVELYY